ncbi:methyltransferase family protein [Algoriphagus pacificus]|uniref:Isoprenylcysteine carboxylmethyltransferase family protein n=1 Tax=Algoriphagus pacificus TaxID=2811234 RepID=A0ABS3CBK1_9BACT|nr:isoprenylcysteine carboxylmethyltransferase family protein [Algoriphagus pacificus]MBN7814492.1 isoprenylcysteine carboxylmethyltransferase family protein [Algoriphagus pacificus]
MDYLLLVGYWTVFYILHSLFASTKLKRILKAKLGDRFKWYRLAYSFFSTIFFLGIMLHSILIPSQKILNPVPILTYLGYVLAAFGTIISVKSSKQIRLKEFIGINPEPEETSLVTDGLYSYCRHPLYLGLLMIFLGYFMVSAQLTALIHFACLVVYLPFGIYFEEQNLRELFGANYEKYQSKVPMLFPALFKKKRA